MIANFVLVRGTVLSLIGVSCLCSYRPCKNTRNESIAKELLRSGILFLAFGFINLLIGIIL